MDAIRSDTSTALPASVSRRCRVRPRRARGTAPDLGGARLASSCSPRCCCRAPRRGAGRRAPTACCRSRRSPRGSPTLRSRCPRRRSRRWKRSLPIGKRARPTSWSSSSCLRPSRSRSRRYALRVAETWKIGRKGQDNGVVMLIARNDKKTRLEVGYGLEGTLTDVTARRIIAEIDRAAIQRGELRGGHRCREDRIIAVVAEGKPLPPRRRNRPDGRRRFDFPMLLLILFIVVPLVGGMLRSIFGKLLGSTVGAGIVGAAAWFVAGSDRDRRTRRGRRLHRDDLCRHRRPAAGRRGGGGVWFPTGGGVGRRQRWRWGRVLRGRRRIRRRRRLGRLGLGPVHTMSASRVARRKWPCARRKTQAGREPAEALQRRAAPFPPQPGGNACCGAPLRVALLAETPGLCIVARLDWHPQHPFALADIV